jgi:polyisoprenoid-binding protein YceI
MMPRFARYGTICVLLCAPTLAAASTWQIDPAHTSAQFAVKHLMVSTVRGTLGKVTGTLNLDETDPTKSTVSASIDAAGIDTREPKRDEHLRSPDFLDVTKYPTITFESTKVEQISKDRFKVTGDLTLRGVKKPVILEVHGAPTPMQDPFGNTKLGGTATTTINRQDYGVAWSKKLDAGGVVVGDDVDITIDLELIKAK